MEDIQASVRRDRLHRLDILLDALERLNLTDARELPPGLRANLEEAGVHVESGPPDFTALIERVWNLQERYLAPGSEAGQGLPPRRGELG